MTYREKLLAERPEYVSPRYLGGCQGCPGSIVNGAPTIETCALNGNTSDEACAACWNREIPKARTMMDILKPHLGRHAGHDLVLAYYGDFDNPSDICIECEDCHEVLISAEAFDMEDTDDG